MFSCLSMYSPRRGVHGLDNGEPGSLETAFCRPLFPVQELPLRQAQQIRRIISPVLAANRSQGGVFPQHGGQLELLEVVFQKDSRFAHAAPSFGKRTP